MLSFKVEPLFLVRVNRTPTNSDEDHAALLSTLLCPGRAHLVFQPLLPPGCFPLEQLDPLPGPFEQDVLFDQGLFRPFVILRQIGQSTCEVRVLGL